MLYSLISRLTSVALLLSFTFFAFAQKTDLLVLKNGNHINGEVKKLVYGVLSFDTDDAGLLSVKWKDVMKLKSSASFELTNKETEVSFGSLDTTTKVREIKLIINGESKIIPMDELVRIIPVKGTFLSRIDGSINAGVNYSKGSDVLKYNFGANVSYRALRDLVKLSGYSEITRQQFTSDTTDITKKQNAELSYARYFNKRWFVSPFAGVEQNTELGLDARIYLGAGGGKDVVYTNLHALNMLGGFVGNREYAASGGSTSNMEGVIAVGYRIYKYTMPKVILTTTVDNYYSLNNPGRIRLNANIRVDFELIDDFTIGISNYHDYDNEPASEGASTYDWGINTTIGYTF